MNDDYISRKAAIAPFAERERIADERAFRGEATVQDAQIAGMSHSVVKILDAIPAADVRPVIPAQWIAIDIYRNEGNYKCSHCEQPCYVPECMGEPMYTVCPHCGADMRGTSA